MDVFSHNGCFSIQCSFYIFAEIIITREELLECVSELSPGIVMDASVIWSLFFNENCRNRSHNDYSEQQQ